LFVRGLIPYRRSTQEYIDMRARKAMRIHARNAVLSQFAPLRGAIARYGGIASATTV
jgi:hypothetical protein